MAAATPSLITKKPSGERSPVHQGRSYSSTSLVRRPALLASVRAMSIVSTPQTSAASRAEMSLVRSEEHTSELQSRENLVCRLLLEKKQNKLLDEIKAY